MSTVRRSFVVFKLADVTVPIALRSISSVGVAATLILAIVPAKPPSSLPEMLELPSSRTVPVLVLSNVTVSVETTEVTELANSSVAPLSIWKPVTPEVGLLVTSSVPPIA